MLIKLIIHDRDLSNVTNQPQLTFPEFATAMYLTSMKMTGSAIPATLPDAIRNEIRNAVSIVQGNASQSLTLQQQPTDMPQQPTRMSSQQHQLPTGISQQPTGIPYSNLSSQPTGFNGNLSSQPTGFNSNLQQPMMTGVTPMMGGPQVAMPTGMLGNNMDFTNRMMPHSVNYIPPANFESLSKNIKIPWAVTAEEKKQYSKIFKAWDKDRKGTLSGDTAKEIFSQSGLPQNVLMQIW
jgi:hypothetical protein